MRTVARYIRIAARGGPAIKIAFWARCGSPSAATESAPKAPTAGLGASGPPRGVDRTAEANSANRSPARSGNAGSAPPASDPAAMSSRTATAPTSTARNEATITGWDPTSEAVLSRSRRWIGSPSSDSSIARCSSRIRSAVANQRGERTPADSMNRRRDAVADPSRLLRPPPPGQRARQMSEVPTPCGRDVERLLESSAERRDRRSERFRAGGRPARPRGERPGSSS